MSEKKDSTEISKNLVRYGFVKIILMNYQNNYVKCLN